MIAKPCPFCGCDKVEPDGMIGELRGKTAFATVCQGCESCGPMALTRRGSLMKWNKRAEVVHSQGRVTP